MAIRSELGCFQAEDVTLTITVVDDAGAAVNITDYTFDFRVKARFASEPVIDVSGGAISLTDPTAGVLTVTLTATDTDIDPNVYEWELIRTDLNSHAVLAYGSLYVRRTIAAAAEGS